MTFNINFRVNLYLQYYATEVYLSKVLTSTIISDLAAAHFPKRPQPEFHLD